MFHGLSTIKILTLLFTGSNIFQVNTLKKEVVWPDNICDDEYLTNWYRDVSNVAGIKDKDIDLSHAIRKCVFEFFRPGKIQTSLISYRNKLQH